MTTASTKTGRPAVEPGFTVIERLVVIAIIVILIALLLPATESAGEAARRAQCSNNLKQIGLAMWNYHDTYDSLPPVFVAGEDGKPMHSWRVLLLPFLEAQPLYDEYSFDEPWDGPNNCLLHDQMLSAYSCPSQSRDNSQTFMTSYVAVVGPDTTFPMDRPTTFKEIADGTSDTILVVEMADSGIHWMDPRDLTVEEMPFLVNSGEGRSPSISSAHPGGAQVVLGDGSVRFLSDTLSTKVLRDLFTIAGGE